MRVLLPPVFRLVLLLLVSVSPHIHILEPLFSFFAIYTTAPCEAVTVTGPYPGAYTVVGEVNRRVDVQSDDGKYHFFWALPAPALKDRERRLRAAADEGGQGSNLVR